MATNQYKSKLTLHETNYDISIIFQVSEINNQ